MKAGILYSIFLTLAIILLFILNLFVGSISVPASAVFDILLGNEVEKTAWYHIVMDSRLPQAITAILTGAALAVSGLLLQTAFRNPLADSGILGISAGANLGVALVVLMLGTSISISGDYALSYSMSIVLGAFIGACLILGIIMGFASVVKNTVMLLIIGIMVGYLTSSIITLLQYWSTSENVYSYMIWGMGNFSSISLDRLPLYSILIIIGLSISIMLIKPLNALLLGDRYASNLGVNIKRVRWLLLLCAGLLTAVTCAYCGPIAFIGLAVPHIARLLLGTSNHKILLPITILMGGVIALLCNLLSVIPGSTGILPLNAVTPIFGAPVIIYVIINQKKIQYFN